MRRFFILGLLAACVWPGAQAVATFHFMQIEQVIGGVGGDTTSQAIQLRMRAGGQNLVQQARLLAWDAAGANPVLVINFTQAVANPLSGARILVASGNFGPRVGGLTPDFTMTNLIPFSYLAAGSLTFEDDFGTVIWRLSWGGAGYTGATGGSFDNDADGEFGPAFAGPLPFAGTQSLRFTGSSSAASTNNAADYALSGDMPTFTNNAGGSGTVMAPVFGDVDGDDDVDLDEAATLAGCLSGPDTALPAPCLSLPFRGGDLDADGFVDLRDVALFQLIYAPP